MAYNYAREAAKATKWAAREEKRKERERRQAEAQERRNRRNSAGFVGDIVMGAAAVHGLATNPVQPPDTGQLSDAHQSQIDARREAIPQATRDQGSGRSGSSRPR